MTKLGKVSVGGDNPVRIMGILNTSPESFYKKSIKTTKQSISNSIKDMELDGADFIDVGGMSTAPYLSTIVSEKVEINRISKAIKIIQNSSNLPISVDTCRASVAKFAMNLGVDIINDISGLNYDDKMIDVISNYNPSLVLGAFSPKKISGNQITLAKNLLKKSINILKKMDSHLTKLWWIHQLGFLENLDKVLFLPKLILIGFYEIFKLYKI